MAYILGKGSGSGGGGGGAPSGPAGGVLSGTYPNPGFAADMATQAELDAVAATIGFKLIEEKVAGAGGAASFDFTSIPGTYRHLEFWYLCKSEGAEADVVVRFNNDSGANYNLELVRGTAGGASAATLSAQTSGNIFGVTATGGAIDASGKVIVPYYALTGGTKTAISSEAYLSSGGNSTGQYAAFWTSTAAITRVTFFIPSIDFKQGSIMSMYGIT